MHSGEDAIKAVCCGADAVQIVSRILQKGPEEMALLLQQFRDWLDENEYQSLLELRGALSARRCPDPEVYRRVNYIRLLQSWHGDASPVGSESVP